FIDNIVYIPQKGFKQALFSLLISYPLALILNQIKYFNKDFSFDYVLTKWGNETERLIYNSLGQLNDIDKLLMVTTKSNKVYIGHITYLHKPIDNTHITIIPTLSGYRNKDNQKVTITTDYT